MKDKSLDSHKNEAQFSRREFIQAAGIAATAIVLSPALTACSTKAGGAPLSSYSGKKLKLYMDTHDKKNGTFPDGITPKQLEGFYEKYQAACKEEGVISIRTHVGFEDGRAYCFNLAPSADAVKRAHEKVGLPFDSITEVHTITPADLALLS